MNPSLSKTFNLFCEQEQLQKHATLDKNPYCVYGTLKNKGQVRNHLQSLKLIVVVDVSRIQRIGCQPEKSTLHGGQSRSWPAEQAKENKKRRYLAAYPPPHPPHCSFGEKNINHATHLQALRRSRLISRPYKDIFGSSTRHESNGGGFAKFYTPVCQSKFRCALAAVRCCRCR